MEKGCTAHHLHPPVQRKKSTYLKKNPQNLWCISDKALTLRPVNTKTIIDMKKFYLIAALAVSALAANAQTTLTLSTYSGTNLEKYSGKALNVSVSRYVFNGWNTISLPIDVSEEELDATFGNDCKLEKLVGVENDGTGVRLNFQDCKAGGIKANTPYILYFTGESGTKRFLVKNALVQDEPASISFTAQGTGETVTMACAKMQTNAKGLYGVLAKDNTEAKFVNVDDVANGFFATRCFIQLSSGNSTVLTTNHITGDVSSIAAVAAKGELVDVYNVSGVKVANKINAAEVNRLQKGIYVVNGKKIMVK